MFTEPFIWFKNQQEFSEIIELAKNFGYKNVVGIVEYSKNLRFSEIEKKIKEIGKKIGINTYFGVLLKTKKEIKESKRFRRKVDLIIVDGGDLVINRIAVETHTVDFLLNPEKNRKDPGFNHIFGKVAARNEIGVLINFSYVSKLQGKKLTKEIENLRTIIRIWERYKFPLAISACCENKNDLKHPKILASFLTILGMDLKNAKKAVSSFPLNILKNNVEKRKKEWIMPGVRVIKWGVTKK